MAGTTDGIEMEEMPDSTAFMRSSTKFVIAKMSRLFLAAETNELK